MRSNIGRVIGTSKYMGGKEIRSWSERIYRLWKYSRAHQPFSQCILYSFSPSLVKLFFTFELLYILYCITVETICGKSDAGLVILHLCWKDFERNHANYHINYKNPDKYW